MKISNDNEKLSLYNQGLNDVEIANKLGQSVSTIAKWRNKNFLPSVSEMKAQNISKLYNNGMTDEVIAQKLELTPYDIKIWRTNRKLARNKSKQGFKEEVDLSGKSPVHQTNYQKSQFPLSKVAIDPNLKANAKIFHKAMEDYLGMNFYTSKTNQKLQTVEDTLKEGTKIEPLLALRSLILSGKIDIVEDILKYEEVGGFYENDEDNLKRKKLVDYLKHTKY